MPWQAPAKTKTQRPWPAVGAKAPGPRAHGGGCQSGFSLREAAFWDVQKEHPPPTVRPLSRGPRALIGLPFSVWTGAYYWHGVGGSVFNSPSSSTPFVRAPPIYQAPSGVPLSDLWLSDLRTVRQGRPHTPLTAGELDRATTEQLRATSRRVSFTRRHPCRLRPRRPPAATPSRRAARAS